MVYIKKRHDCHMIRKVSGLAFFKTIKRRHLLRYIGNEQAPVIIHMLIKGKFNLAGSVSPGLFIFRVQSPIAGNGRNTGFCFDHPELSSGPRRRS